MKKIHWLKIYTVIASILFIIMCGVDYTKVYLKGQKHQSLWPIYSWALGFQKIPKETTHGYLEIISCNGILLDKSVSIKKFAKQNKVAFYNNSHYKYGKEMVGALNKAMYEKYEFYKNSLEAQILSKLPCDTIKYNAIHMSKNLITREEKKYLVKSLKYIKQ